MRAAPDAVPATVPEAAVITAATALPEVRNISIDRIRRARRLTMLLVEQRVAEALELCDRGCVRETGGVALDGAQRALLADPRVQRAHLGA